MGWREPKLGVCVCVCFIGPRLQSVLSVVSHCEALTAERQVFCVGK